MAAGNATLTTYGNALKKVYASADARKMLYENSPLLAMLPKVNDFVGKDYNVDVIIAGQGGVASTLQAAITNKSSSENRAFTVTRGRIYAQGSIDREVMLAAAEKGGSMIFGALKNERDTLALKTGRRLSRQLFQDGTGNIGNIGSISGSTIVLSKPEDVIWWEIGDTVQAASALGVASRAGTLIVSAVDRTGVPTITFTTPVTTGIAAAVAGDFLFPNGDNSGDGAPVLMGLAGWLAGSAATSTAFFGVDRTVDKLRLAGMAYAGNGAFKLQTIRNALPTVFVNGGKPKLCVVSPYDYADICNSIDGQTRFEKKSGGDKSVSIGFTVMTVTGPGGDVEILQDMSCPAGVFYLLDMSTWGLHFLATSKEFPELVNNDGNDIRMDPTTDSFTWRLAGYGNITCNAPGKNLRGTF